MAMLDMLCRGGYVGKGDGQVADKTKGEKETVWDQGIVVYVEFCGIIGGVDRTEIMRNVAEGRGLKFVGLRAEDVFDPSLHGRSTHAYVAMDEREETVVDLRQPGNLSPCICELANYLA